MQRGRWGRHRWNHHGRSSVRSRHHRARSRRPSPSPGEAAVRPGAAARHATFASPKLDVNAKRLLSVTATQHVSDCAYFAVPRVFVGEDSPAVWRGSARWPSPPPSLCPCRQAKRPPGPGRGLLSEARLNTVMLLAVGSVVIEKTAPARRRRLAPERHPRRRVRPPTWPPSRGVPRNRCVMSDCPSCGARQAGRTVPSAATRALRTSCRKGCRVTDLSAR